jgi:hypothetical protein
MPPDDRIWRRWLEKVEVTEDHWWWTATPGSSGYGQFWYMGEYVGAHVMACHLFFGTPIHRPRSESVDHLCREPLCVRPSHLDPTSQSDNLRRAPHNMVTECPFGHQYTAENTYIYRGMRHCRTCHREREALARREGRRGR